MPLKHAVLALIAERRGYGYDLVQRFEERVGPGWRLNPSAVYPALDQLERDGLATERRPPGGTRRSPRVVYAPTPAGNAALDALAADDGRAARAGARRPAPAARVRAPEHRAALAAQLAAHERACAALLARYPRASAGAGRASPALDRRRRRRAPARGAGLARATHAPRCATERG